MALSNAIQLFEHIIPKWNRGDGQMDLSRLQYFVTLAQTQSFSETAEVLYTTQGIVSKQIAHLENELNLQLVDRRKRQIVLTEAGQVLLEHARTLLNDYQAMLQDVSQFASRDLKEIRICSIPVMAHYHITQKIAAFGREYPHIKLTFREIEGVDIDRELEKRQADVAFTRTGYAAEPRWEKVVLDQDCLAVVLPKQHLLAGRKVIALRELAEENFLFQEKSTNLYQLSLAACQASGFHPHIVYTSRRMENIMAFVADEMGVALMMSEIAHYLQNDRVVIVPLEEKIVSEISLVRLPQQHYPAHLEAFWTFFKERFNLVEEKAHS